MTPVSQLIWRHRERLVPGGGVLLVNPPADDLAVQLRGLGCAVECHCLSQASNAYQQARGIESRFSLEPGPSSARDHVILYQPREKPLLRMLLDYGVTLTRERGVFWLAGENQAGIRSAGRQLASFFEDWRKADSARHCALFEATRPRAGKVGAGDDWLARHFEAWSFEIRGRSFTIHSLPGVFAHGRLDAGTAVLLEALTSGASGEPVGGRVLDFACGAGTIGIALAGFRPDIELTLLDDAWPAIESTRRSLAANGLDAQVVASDGLTALKPGSQPPFDWIVSNPPFHAGVRQELSVARRFFRDARDWLAPSGRLCLVGNVHLPYGRWLSELFASVQVIAADHGYHVWLARQPAIRPHEEQARDS
ncbi:MAG: class I SAM-dependent methyltransferase [Xanthomonadales bacterium]|nr:class I SAM-dependent methyltransferase [Xanthomonadales bacterium]